MIRVDKKWFFLGLLSLMIIPNNIFSMQEKPTTLWGVFGPVISEGARALVSGIKSTLLYSAKVPFIYASKNPNRTFMASLVGYSTYLINQYYKLYKLNHAIDCACEPKQGTVYEALREQKEFLSKEGSNALIEQERNKINQLQKKLRSYAYIPHRSLNEGLNWQWDGLSSPGRYIMNSSYLLCRIMRALYKPFAWQAHNKYENLEQLKITLRNLK